MVATVTTGLY